MEIFAKMVNDWRYFRKSSILDIFLGSEYARAYSVLV